MKHSAGPRQQKIVSEMTFLDLVDWTTFKCLAENLDEYATNVTNFFSKCLEDSVPKKSIRVFPKRKPWMNQEIHSLLKTRCAAFESGDLDEYRKSRSPDTPVPSITAADVRSVFLGVNPRKVMDQMVSPAEHSDPVQTNWRRYSPTPSTSSSYKLKSPPLFKKTTISP
eukprot:g31258.t1